MACIYSDFDGKCTLYDENFESNGSDKYGNCLCEDDPDPSFMCGEYELDEDPDYEYE